MTSAATAIITSPRYLVLRDLKKVLAPAPDPITIGDERGVVKPADPGCMQLFSYYMPSLVAGGYSIKVSQEVSFTSIPGIVDDSALHKVLNVKSNSNSTLRQRFEVIAPQYTIDSANIHSTYPPQGQADQPNVLPHIVFSDPHLPWERPAADPVPDGLTYTTSQPQLPWLAVFPFDCNGPAAELRLSDDQLAAIKKIVGVTTADPTQAALPFKQSTTFTTTMSLKQYRRLANNDDATITNIRIPIVKDVQVDDATPVDVLFMNQSLYKLLFPDQNLNSYKYCAHVRNVNTVGMTDAGVDENGLFSIVHSLRTGPYDVIPNTPPRTQVVHLLSLEGVHSLNVINTVSTAATSVGTTDLVAFVSLYSWTYLCQPPLSVNFVDSMRQIGSDIDDLRLSPYLACPKPTTDAMQQSLEKAAAGSQLDGQSVKLNRAKLKMISRLKNGYTLVRHRPVSGEETVAINRGALLPVRSKTPNTSWPYSSTNGQDFQILDTELGIMDISYSSAWQLGKTMAISDLGLVAALLRIRADAYRTGMIASKSSTATQIAGFNGKTAMMKRLSISVAHVQSVSSTPSISSNTVANHQERWQMTSKDRGDLLQSKNDPALVAGAKQVFRAAVQQEVGNKGSNADTDGSVPYDEINAPADVDWAFVQSWLLDRMYLYNIPGHYLVPEPNFLPPETMRFFHIDQVWMEALIDGALSVANHMDKQDDLVRDGIKKCMNKYFSTPFSGLDEDGTITSLHYPQVPVYGFLLRSAVVEMFPDLVVEVPYPLTDDEIAKAQQADSTGKTTDESITVSSTSPATSTSGMTSMPRGVTSIVQNGRTSILVQKNMGKGILMVLLDRVPDDGEIAYIQITQPTHQQRFSAGDYMNDIKIEFQFRDPVYDTASHGVGFLKTVGDLFTFNKDGTGSPSTRPASPYDWDSRCLDMLKVQTLLFGTAGAQPDGTQRLTSAVTGLEFNDTIKYLQLKPPASAIAMKLQTSQQKPFQFRVRPDPPKSSTAQSSKPKDSTSKKAAFAAPPSLSAPQLIPSILSSISSASTSAATPPKRDPAPTVSGLNTPRAVTQADKQKAVQKVMQTAVQKAVAPTPVGSGATAGTQPMAQGGPCYACRIYPSTQKFTGKAGDSTESYAWIDTPYDSDLIFSLRRINKKDGFELRAIELYIPIGADRTLPRATPRAPIEKAATISSLGIVKQSPCGVRCRMLSNQRWVVHTDALGNGEYVLLRVVPRSTRRSSPIADNLELSFRLDEVTLDPGGDASTSFGVEGKVQILKREVYGVLANPGQIGKEETWTKAGYFDENVWLRRKKGFQEPPNYWDE